MRCENVTVDLSDRDNPEGIVFPSGYTGSTDNSWRGFYIGQLTLQLPEGIRGWRSSEPPRATIRHLLADRTGLSLEATVTNILRYPESNLGGWGGSIDTLGLIIRQNSLHRGRMSGRILVPVSDSALVYSAILRDTAGGIRFEFTVQPRGTLNIPLWAASLQLDNTSWVRLEAGAGVGRGFVARANFTGRISFGGTRDIPLTMGGIQFQNMLIRTDQRPYISVGSWSFASPPHSILGPPEPVPLSPDGSGSGSRTLAVSQSASVSLILSVGSAEKVQELAYGSELMLTSKQDQTASAVEQLFPFGVHSAVDRRDHPRLSSAALTSTLLGSAQTWVRWRSKGMCASTTTILPTATVFAAEFGQTLFGWWW